MGMRRPGFVLGFRLKWALFSLLAAAVVLGLSALVFFSGFEEDEGDGPPTPTPQSSVLEPGKRDRP